MSIIDVSVWKDSLLVYLLKCFGLLAGWCGSLMERRERLGYERSGFEPGLSVLKIAASVDETEMEPMSCAFHSPSSSPQPV